MSVPSYVKGSYFSVAVSLDNGATYTAMCGLNSRNLTEAYQTSDEYVRDCNDPTSTPFRLVNVTGQSFDIAGTGTYNRAQGDLIRQLGGKSLFYRYIMNVGADEKLRADLILRVEKLERKLEEKDAQHEAEMGLVRHRANNSDQCIDALLMLLEQSPDKVKEAVAMIKSMRERHRATEALEKATIRGATIMAKSEAAQ